MANLQIQHLGTHTRLENVYVPDWQIQQAMPRARVIERVVERAVTPHRTGGGAGCLGGLGAVILTPVAIVMYLFSPHQNEIDAKAFQTAAKTAYVIPRDQWGSAPRAELVKP